MQLNDILEENSIKAISLKTKISENNLENLFSKKFENLKKVKTLGFISIMEREYSADLGNLRDEAQEYYAQVGEDKSITLGFPILEEKKGSSKFFIFFIFLLFATATWYFLTQLDKKNLSELIPFIDESTIESFIGADTEEEVVENLSITKVSETNMKDKVDEVEKSTVEDVIREDKSVVISQNVTDITPETMETSDDSTETIKENPAKEIISIVPVNRLWFGIINMETKERDHFSISDVYELDVSLNSWLLATSSAPFFLKAGVREEEFSDAKEHYFKMDKDGVTSLSRSEYIVLGGWVQW